MQEGKNIRNQARGKAWLKKELTPFRFAVAWLTVLAVLTTALSVAFAYLVRYLVNGAAAGNTQTLIAYAIVLIVLLLVRIALQILKNYLTERACARMTTELRAKSFSRLLRADYSALEAYHSGDLLNRLTSDVNEVATDSVALLPAVVGMAVQAVGAVAALVALDPLFTGIYASCALVVGGFTALCRRSLKRIQKALSQADGNSRAFIQESEASVMTIKAYGAEGRTDEKSNALLADYYQKRMERNKIRTGVNGVFSLLGGLGTIFALVWCGISIVQGQGDYGALFSVMLLLGQLQRPVTAFSSIMPLYYAREGAAERLCEISLLQEEAADTSACEAYEVRAVEAENLSFSYRKGNRVLFDGASAQIGAGELVCITGESGSGKSTFFKLLLSVYHADEGGFHLCVERDGAEERLPLTAAHRALFAYVPQGNFLFSGSIYENLCFFAPNGEASDEQIRSALETACAEFVYELKEGLNTPLQERGGGLSEGQVQRLAVARALLSAREILLLDEATSALDEQTEERMLANLARARKTCMIVTHRPAALRLADRVLHVEGGKIVRKAGRNQA